MELYYTLFNFHKPEACVPVTRQEREPPACASGIEVGFGNRNAILDHAIYALLFSFLPAVVAEEPVERQAGEGGATGGGAEGYGSRGVAAEGGKIGCESWRGGKFVDF